VRFTEWTSDGSLRHPSFEGLRDDKKPDKVVREVEKPVAPLEAKAERKTRRTTKRTAKAPRARRRSAAEDEDEDGELVIGKLVITHPERVVDAESGITKGDLARYAGVVAPLILRHAKKRPLMLVRCTETWDGRGFGTQGRHPRRGSCFVQKHSGRGLVANIGRGDVEGEEVLYVTKEDEVVSLFQLNAVELHGWGSRMPSYDKPDWVVFDLDPDVGLDFDKVKAAAVRLKALLEDLGLKSFPLLSGGKGIHVVVPLDSSKDWPTVKSFAERFSRAISEAEPQTFTANIRKVQRKGRIFLDWLRNQRGATAVMPYSARAREGAPVSAPIAWQELDRYQGGNHFSIRDVNELLDRSSSKLLAGWGEAKQALPDA
jgi:bifunctional non-homologous end joining protein LigD